MYSGNHSHTVMALPIVEPDVLFCYIATTRSRTSNWSALSPNMEVQFWWQGLADV